MPARPAPETPETRAINELLDEDDAAIKQIAAESGPPSGASRLSESEEDTAWETMDPLVDDEQFATTLMTQGLPPEVAQQLLVVQMHKDDPETQQAWLETLTQPTQDAEYANLIRSVVKWPFRSAVYNDIDDPDERVAKADSMHRRYTKRMASLQENIAQPGLLKTTAGYQGMEQ